MALAEVILQAHLLVFDECQGLLEIYYLEFCLILQIVSLACLVLAVVDLSVEGGDLLSRFTDIFLQCGIIALNSLKLLL